MHLKTLLPWLFGILVLIIAGLTYFHFIYFSGFPDGYQTAFDQANIRLFTVFIFFSMAFAGYSFRLGWEKPDSSKKLLFTILFFAISVIIFFAISYYLYFQLDHGGGG